MINNTSHSLSQNDTNSKPSKKETTPGGEKEIRWEIVARTPGLMPATIMAGRLEVEDIPVRVWQEGAGQAMGLTVGLLGTGYVAVPQEFVEKAKQILSEEHQDLEEE